MSDYPHVNVRERGSVEGHRENSNAINHLLGEVSVIQDDLQSLRLLLREYGVMNGAATENLPIDNWDNAGVATPDTLMTADAATGLFTVQTPGAYTVSVTLTYTGSGNNVDYSLGFYHNSISSLPFAWNLWTNQTTQQSFSAIGLISMVAGDTLGIVKVDGAAMTSIGGMVQLKLAVPS